MAFFKNLFSGNKSEISVHLIPEDKLLPEHLEVHKTFRHGLPHKPSCLAYDSVQQLLAIGSHQGEIIILGKAGLERHFNHGDSTAVLQMIFIENRGLLVTRCSNNTLYQWNITNKYSEITHTLEVKDESPCLMSWRFGSDWIYVGTEQSSIYVVNLRKFQISEYKIHQDAVSESSTPIGEVVAIAEQPYHKKKLLLAYMSGLCILWNLEGRLIKRQFSLDTASSVNMLVSAVWHGSGHKFAAAYTNGSIAIFNADDGKLERLLTCRGNPDPAFQLQWFNVDSPESWLLFAGIFAGSRSSSSSRHLTIHSSQETQLLSFPDPIISFLCLPSSPYASAVQEPSCLAVLTQEEIVMLDLQQPSKLLPFSLAHALDLNCSPVTSIQLCGKCPDEFVALLSVMQSKSTLTDLSTKPWPLIGGRWGNEPLDSWADLVVTGHMDGSIRFWICRSVTMKLLFTTDTMKYFKQVVQAGPSHSTISQSSQPLNSISEGPEVIVDTDLDTVPPLMVVNGSHEEERSGTKPRPHFSAIKKGASKIGKIVGRTRSSQLSSGDEEQLSPMLSESSSNLGDDDVFSRRKKPKGSMRVGRTSFSNIEYLSYETATHAMPPSSRKPVIAHMDAEDGEYFAIHKLNMDVHSQTLVVANCAGHVLALDFLSRPFQTHSDKQSVVVDFSQDTVLNVEKEESGSSPSFVVTKWAFCGDSPTLARSRKLSIPSDVQLIHHCQCFLKEKGVPFPVVITSLQFSRSSKILAIGSEAGLAIVDISWNKCVTLMSQLLSILYMADPKGHMDQLTQQRTQPQDKMKSPITRSEFLHRVSLVRKNSLPLQHQTSHLALLEDASDSSEEEGRKVTCLGLVQLILQKGHTSKLTLWVGTASGHVTAYIINTVQASQVITDVRRELVPTGLVITLQSQVTGLFFLNERGEQLLTPFPCATGTQPSSQAASKKESGPTYTIISSRNYIKSVAFPGNKDIGFNEPELTGSCLLSSSLFMCQGLPCLLNLTSTGDILVHSLPKVQHLITVPYAPLQDSRALHTFQVSGDGQAVHFISPSEIQRLSVTRNDHTNLPHCLPDVYVHREDPEDPSTKRKGFSGSKAPSDRSHLFGDPSRFPVLPSERRSSREEDPSSHSIPQKRTSPSIRHRVPVSTSSNNGRRRSRDEGDNVFSKAKQQLDQRGEDLSKLEETTQAMVADSEEFGNLAMKLKEKYQQRK